MKEFNGNIASLTADTDSTFVSAIGNGLPKRFGGLADCYHRGRQRF